MSDFLCQVKLFGHILADERCCCSPWMLDEHVCVCVCSVAFFIKHVLSVSYFFERVCFTAGSDSLCSQHTNLFNSHGACVTDRGEAFTARSTDQPLKQALRLQQRSGAKPSLHSPHQASCLFSEALEETLNRTYQIQTVARLCYFTHKPPLNSASFSLIVFLLLW